jgi:hypothetical protein
LDIRAVPLFDSHGPVAYNLVSVVTSHDPVKKSSSDNLVFVSWPKDFSRREINRKIVITFFIGKLYPYLI